MPLLVQLFEREAREKRTDLAAALAGLRRYQKAPRPPDGRTRTLHAERGPVKLWRRGEWVAGRPCVLLIPSIINGPEILDLAPGHSLLDHLDETANALLLDWGAVDEARAEESLDLLVTRYLLPLVEGLEAPPHLAGYCLGGLFALALTHLTAVRSLTLIAAPWRFAAYAERQRAPLLELWDAQREACRRLGLMPVELMQCGFWTLEPDRMAAKYARAREMDETRFERFVEVEDWANGGEPLMLAAAGDLLDVLMRADATGSGTWRVAGKRIDGPAPNVPCLSVRSTADRIVPQVVSAAFGTVRDVASGHVGMMVGSRRREQLWRPLTDWVAEHEAV